MYSSNVGLNMITQSTPRHLGRGKNFLANDSELRNSSERCVHSAPRVFKDNFQHLQKTCPIVNEGDKFEYTHCKLPTNDRNYTLVDPNKVKFFVAQKENALPYLNDILAHSNNEAQVTETLYILDRMIDHGTKGIEKMYPTLSRFNDTKSPNIQTFLAGIYRKTLVPDAFGPLIKMLIQNSINPQPAPFDPNEEIGGAILEYVARFKSKSSVVRSY